MAQGLTRKQLDELRRKLEDERARIARVLGAPTSSATGDDQETEIEEAAQRATERAHEHGVRDRERALLGEVERALAKFGDGTYGLSEETGEPIRYERLAAVPWARRDIEE